MSDPTQGAFEGAVWFAAVVAVFGLGVAILAYARRRLRGNARGERVPFSLEELKRLRAAGELSEEEFKRLRAAVVRSLGASGES